MTTCSCLPAPLAATQDNHVLVAHDVLAIFDADLMSGLVGIEYTPRAWANPREATQTWLVANRYVSEGDTEASDTVPLRLVRQ